MEMIATAAMNESENLVVIVGVSKASKLRLTCAAVRSRMENNLDTAVELKAFLYHHSRFHFVKPF